MQAASLTSRPVGVGSKHHAAHAPARRPARVSALPKDGIDSMAERAGLLLTGLAAGAALGMTDPAMAVTAAAPTQAAPAKADPATSPPPLTRPPAELQAELEKRNADTLNKLISDLEASKVAAVKSVGDLQKRLATEHGQMLKLQGELSRARSDLKASQSEVEKEKTALVAAKKQAADAAEAARAAELALRGQAGLESLKSPLGLAATSGWTLAAIVAVTKNKKEDRDGSLLDWDSSDQGEMRAALETNRAETEALRKELTVQQKRLAELTAQLDSERGQNATLRETVLIMEAEVTDLEARMVAAKTEAFDLQRKLDMATGGRGAAVSYNGNGDSKSGLPLFTSSKAKDEGKSKASSAFSSSSSSSSKFASAAGSKSSTAGFANGAVSAGGLSSGKAVRITFSLQQELPFGQSLKLVGSHPALGAWKEDMGPVMQWTQGHKWQCSVTLPAGSALEFKAVKMIGDGPDARAEWEEGPNHVLLVPASGYTDLTVKVEWGAGTAVLDYMPATSGASTSSSSSSSSSSSAPSSTIFSTNKKEDRKALASTSKWGGLLG